MNFKEALLTVAKVIAFLIVTGFAARITFEVASIGWNVLP